MFSTFCVCGKKEKFEGTEVDAAVERVQNLDNELAQKVGIDTTINNIPSSAVST